MAELGEPYRLFAGEIDVESLHVEGHNSSDCIIITTGRRHVSVYDVHDSQPQNSWTLMSGHSLTRGAVLNPADGRYAAVVDNKIVRLWTKNETTFNKSKKITMSKSVHGLITRGRFEPLVVYADGSLAWLSSSAVELSGACLSEVERLAWVDATLLKEDELVVVMVTQTADENANKKVQVFVVKENAESVTGRQFEEPVTWESSACTSLRTTGTQAAVLYMDQAGHLTETHLTGQSFGRSTRLHPVPLATMTGGTICALGPSHLAVCGARSPTGTPCIGVWDTKFGILQAWKPLPGSPSESGRMCLHRQGSRVALGSRSGMYIYSFTCRHSTLGAALGKFSATCVTVSQEPALNRAAELLMQLADPQQTKTHMAFSKAFNLLTVELDQKDKHKTTASSHLLNAQHLVAAVLKRAVNEKAFWPHDELHLLIKRGIIPASMLSDVMTALTAHEELVLLHSCVSVVPDIPESALVHCLQYVLRVDDAKFEVFGKKKKKPVSNIERTIAPGACPFSKPKAGFVQRLLSLPYNEVFLAGHLKHIDFQSSLNLLQYLHYLLETNQVGKKSKGGMSLIVVVDWLGMLLDAHFTQMILSPEARSLLVNLHQTVEQQVQFYNELVGLESILAQIKEKCSLPRKQYPGLYNIHVLHVM